MCCIAAAGVGDGLALDIGGRRQAGRQRRVLGRIGAGVGQTVPIVFIAYLYGIPLSAAQLATIAMTAVVVSFSVPGIPGGTIIAMVPVLMSAGLPIEGAGLMFGVDTIPDMFRTTANVTGDMTAAVVLGAREKHNVESVSLDDVPPAV